MSTLPRFIRGATLWLSLAALAPAWADRPLVSETADVIDAGACQLEAWASRTRHKGGGGDRGAAGVASCGVGGSHQFGLGAQRSRDAGDSDPLQALALTGKSTLRAPVQGRLGVGLAYALGFERTAGQGLRREATSVLGALTQPLADGTLIHANLGWLHSRSSGHSSTTWSLGVERGDDPVLAADIYGDDRTRPWVSAGAGWSLLDKLSFNASVAQQVDRKRARQLSVGVKLQF
jgi:hypothetical protein